MSEHTYRVIEVVGSSPDGTDAAIANAIARVSQTTRNVEWFEVTETRGHVVDGAIGHIQVTLKVGFRIDPADAVDG
ncbi:dodecin [Gordonia insulae]|uniref:Dodecin n=1 Tax=Gordonia insulae TaxID=2420509 RepID=A0A3G8JHP6_9ACTN|nr:dodecin [Gordonia insulae]AZG44606.1 Dodecin [Gordonia insulae]